MTTVTTLRRVRHGVLASVAAVAMASIAPEAWGQTVAANEWRHGTTLAGFVGAASPSSDTTAAAGAALGWEITPHFTLEGRGMWFDTGRGAEAFAAVLGSRVPLLPARPVVPFLSAGVGVYRATFDSMSSTMPRFYQRRMMSGAAGLQRRVFDDFVVALGGGVDVFLARHLVLRPDVTVLLVAARSDMRAVPVVGVHLAYHFESHPITPGRR